MGVWQRLGGTAAALLLSAIASSGIAAEITLDAEQALGKAMFFDLNLSRHRNQSCAVCHLDAVGWTGPDASLNAAGAAYQGSVAGRFGNRKPPAIAYMASSPTLHREFDDGEPLFVGGAFWNGRATGEKLGSPLADQAGKPFLNPVEQALPDAACVVERVCRPAFGDAYPVRFQDVWGEQACAIAWPADIDDVCAREHGTVRLAAEHRRRVDDGFDRIALSIAAFEASPAVSPYSSKFDAYLQGKIALSEHESLGLKVFENKGKCADCHPLERGPNGEPPVFTDFTFDNLGVPANPRNPWYAMTSHNPEGPAWKDRGLYEHLITTAEQRAFAADNDGKHKVPTLRNVDLRTGADFVKAYMHNGYFKTLEGVVSFYNSRDVRPRCDDPLTSEADALANGCWPAPEVAANVNNEELGDLRLTAVEEAALVAFMKTLSDGFAP